MSRPSSATFYANIPPPDFPTLLRCCSTGSVTRGEAEEVGRQTGRLLAGGTLEED